MARIYLQEKPSEEGIFDLGRDVKKRLTKVLRLGTGDSVQAIGMNHKWECRISRISEDGIQLKVIRELTPLPSAKLHLILGQAIPKGEKFELLIQKSTELGIAELFPLITVRTIVKPTKLNVKLQRWNEIAEQAAGQSENPTPTIVHSPRSLQDFLEQDHGGLRIFLHERDRSAPLRKILQETKPDRITFVVGPEGGWTAGETASLEKSTFKRVNLGSRILRSETAGLVLASILQYELGDFSGQE